MFKIPELGSTTGINSTHIRLPPSFTYFFQTPVSQPTFACITAAICGPLLVTDDPFAVQAVVLELVRAVWT